MAERDRRGAHLRGKARAEGDAPDPPGGRVWDLNCGRPMQRLARGPEYRSTCGLNQQSDSRTCAYNWVDGPTAARCVRLRLLSPAAQAKLPAKLAELAAAEVGDDAAAGEVTAKRAALADVARTLDRVPANMTLAEAQGQAMAGEFKRLRAEHGRREAEVEGASAAPARSDPAAEVDAAMEALDRLPELAARADDVAAVQALVRRVGAKLYLGPRTAVLGHEGGPRAAAATQGRSSATCWRERRSRCDCGLIGWAGPTCVRQGPRIACATPTDIP